MRRGRQFAIALATMLVGCELIVDTSGLDDGKVVADAAVEAAPIIEARADATVADASVVGADADAARTCPSKGSAMVLVSAPGVAPFCVDSTEVTNGKFDEFLGSSPSVDKLAPVCTWKTTFNVPGGGSDVALVNVDWCDAVGYCAWAGKRLCGKIGGGTNAFSDFADATKSEWYFACTDNGATSYPYGQSYVPGLCNDDHDDAGGPVPPKSAAGCQGGFSGIYDLSGNVWEWEDSCTSDGGVPGAQDKCRVRGGCWVDEDPTVRCDYDYQQHFDPRRGSPDGHVGFRCCADAN